MIKKTTNSGQKILQVVPSLNTGGVEQGTIDIAEALYKGGFQPFVATQGGRRLKELEAFHTKILTLPLASKNPWCILRNSYRLEKLIRQHQIDLVHARSRAPAWSAYLACKRVGIPFVTTFHGTYNFNNSLKKYYNSVMVKGQRVIAISQFIYDHIATSYKEYVAMQNVRVIHRGVDVAVFSPKAVDKGETEKLKASLALPENSFVILMPARLTAWKGQKVVLEALSYLKPLRFVCIFAGPADGKQSYKNELEALAQHHGLKERIRFVEGGGTMPTLYSIADVVVHASTDPEAFGRVIAEAQAMGKPVIASDHGAPSEIIIHHETGWLVPPFDARGLCEKLHLVASLSKDQRKKLADIAINHVKKNFSKEEMSRKTLKVYQELLEE